MKTKLTSTLIIYIITFFSFSYNSLSIDTSSTWKKVYTVKVRTNIDSMNVALTDTLCCFENNGSYITKWIDPNHFERWVDTSVYYTTSYWPNMQLTFQMHIRGMFNLDAKFLYCGLFKFKGFYFNDSFYSSTDGYYFQGQEKFVKEWQIIDPECDFWHPLGKLRPLPNFWGGHKNSLWHNFRIQGCPEILDFEFIYEPAPVWTYLWYDSTQCHFDREISIESKVLANPNYKEYFTIPSTELQVPVKITPKEGYRISGIKIDTLFIGTKNATTRWDINLDFSNIDEKYFKLEPDGSIIVYLDGYYVMPFHSFWAERMWPESVLLDSVYMSRTAMATLTLPYPQTNPYYTSNYWRHDENRGYCIEVLTEPLHISEPQITNITLAPNPTNSSTTLTLSIEKPGTLQITLTNNLGQLITELYNNYTDATLFTHIINTAELSPGAYFVKIVHNGYEITEQFIKK